VNRYSEIIKLVAENHGETYSAVYQEIQEALHFAATNPDELARQRYRNTFGDNEPTPEEALEKLTTILRELV